MTPSVREVEGGLGQYSKGYTPPPKRDSVKLTHKKVVKAFRELGDQALNAADFERTRHLPVGRGRLACDPETGEFDADAVRPQYNPGQHPEYPRWIHSTITEGESKLVDTEEDHKFLLATKKWADKPMEKKKRFTLTQEDQMQNFQGQILAERARSNELERRLESLLAGGDNPEAKENQTLLAMTVDTLAKENEELKARFEALMAKLEEGGTPKVEPDPDNKGNKRK